MALDTREKRDSAVALTLPWRNRYPLPDGLIDQGDRQHISLIYAGILAGAPAVQVDYVFGIRSLPHYVFQVTTVGAFQFAARSEG